MTLDKLVSDTGVDKLDKVEHLELAHLYRRMMIHCILNYNDVGLKYFVNKYFVHSTMFRYER